MSFYASQFNDKSSRYCSSNLYGSNLSTVYADGPPPLDDTLEEDDGEIVFRDKNPKKDSPKSKLDNDKSQSAVSGESDPWSNNDRKGEAEDDFGGFTGFADFSSAFGGNSKSQNDPSWFKNGDNDQSSVTNFNHSFPSHQGKISSSFRKTDEKSEEKTGKDDDFGCFSGDDSDFDDAQSFTSSSRNVNTGESEENDSKDSRVSVDSEIKKTTSSDELFKNEKTIHGSTERSNYSFEQSAKKSNIDSADDFDKYSSFVGGNVLNGSSMSPTNNSSTSHVQGINSNAHSTMKPTCFSDDDDDDFGDFSSSSFDDDRGGITKSPDLIVKPQQANFTSQAMANESQNTHMNKSSSIQNSKSQEIEHDSKEANDNDETVQLSQYDGSETSATENGKDFDTHINDDNDDSDDGFGEFSASISSVTKTEDNKSKQLSSDNNINDHDNDDDDFGKFGVGSPPSLSSFHDDEFGADILCSEDNNKTYDDDDDFGEFGAAPPPSVPNPNGNSNDDEFGDFGSDTGMSKLSLHGGDIPTSLSEEKPKDNKKDDDANEFGDFGAAFPPQNSGIHDKSDIRFNDSGGVALEGKPKSYDDDEFGDFGSVPVTDKPDFQDDKPVTAGNNNDDAFGDFGSVPANKPDFQDDKPVTAGNDDDDDAFGDFGSVPITNKPDFQDDKAVTACNENDDDDDEFGDFSVVPSTSPKQDNHDSASPAGYDDDVVRDLGSNPATSKADIPNNNDDADDFGDFGVASPTVKQNDDDFGDFAEVEQQSSKDNKSKSIPLSLEPKGFNSNDNEDDEFGQFDSAPNKPSDSDFADFKSSDASKGFADFSSLHQKPLSSSFNTRSGLQSFSSNDAQHGKPKVTGSTSVVKPQRRTDPDRLGNAIKECFTNNNVTKESHIIIQKMEHEVKPERCSAWQQLLTSEKDGSLRFDWVLSEHQVKMLEGLSMVPVKIQTSFSFKPKGQVPPPLFASSMSLLEPVKGVITPFHHVEEINPSQDPFGAPPEVGLQDLGFGKASKKETFVLPTEVKDSASDTMSVSSSLDLDFLAPSTNNGDSTKTESRGLFEDDLLGLGMFSGPSPSPKTTNGKNIFKFNNTTLPLVTSEGNLSEPAKVVIKDFEDLSFMLSRVLMFPLKSKE